MGVGDNKYCNIKGLGEGSNLSEFLLLIEGNEGFQGYLIALVLRITLPHNGPDILHIDLLIQLLSEGLQILLGDIPLLININLVKDLHYLHAYPFNILILIVFAWLLRHHLHKLPEINLPTQIGIIQGDDLIDEVPLAVVAPVLDHRLVLDRVLRGAGPSV